MPPCSRPSRARRAQRAGLAAALDRDGGLELGRDGGTVLLSIEQRNSRSFAKRLHVQFSSKVHTGSARPTIADKGIGPK
jgi:hypothetical protein